MLPHEAAFPSDAWTSFAVWRLADEIRAGQVSIWSDIKPEDMLVEHCSEAAAVAVVEVAGGDRAAGTAPRGYGGNPVATCRWFVEDLRDLREKVGEFLGGSQGCSWKLAKQLEALRSNASDRSLAHAEELLLPALQALSQALEQVLAKHLELGQQKPGTKYPKGASIESIATPTPSTSITAPHKDMRSASIGEAADDTTSTPSNRSTSGSRSHSPSSPSLHRQYVQRKCTSWTGPSPSQSGDSENEQLRDVDVDIDVDVCGNPSVQRERSSEMEGNLSQSDDSGPLTNRWVSDLRRLSSRLGSGRHLLEKGACLSSSSSSSGLWERDLQGLEAEGEGQGEQANSHAEGIAYHFTIWKQCRVAQTCGKSPSASLMPTQATSATSCSAAQAVLPTKQIEHQQQPQHHHHQHQHQQHHHQHQEQQPQEGHNNNNNNA
mmetsp:Transcript_52108/g.113449  ORF Transcript_52108/g.113449 Transcript_52108/m.113449 type:complete len:434 (-) Transcript_52108:275-1576(-)